MAFFVMHASDITRSLLLCALLFTATNEGAYADAISVYRGQGVDANLLEIPGDILSGDLAWEPTYFWGLSYRWHTKPPEWLASTGRWIGLSNIKTGLELIEVKHSGLQDNFETDLAYVLELTQLEFWGVTLRLTIGYGPSIAHGTPSYEDGSEENPEKRYKFQLYGMYETEWGLRDYPAVTLVYKVHHRSGGYGLIAPPKVGSNFMTWGLRYRF
jgi:hypothetical protein